MEYNLAFDQELLKKNNNMFVIHASLDYSVLPCSAPYMMLAYAAHSEGGHFINNTHHHVREGDIFLIKPNVTNGFYSTIPGHYLTMYCCVFMPEILRYPLEWFEKDFPLLKSFLSGNQDYLRLTDTPSKDIRDFFIRLIDDFSYSRPCHEYSCQCLISLMTVNIFKIISADKEGGTKFNKNVVVGNAVNYVNQNIYKKISMSELAAQLHITPQHMCRIFKKHMGMTFTEFVNNLRVDRIKDELEHTDRPIYLIYESFDFSSRYIDKIFRESTGYSLQQYKKKFNYKVNNSLY